MRWEFEGVITVVGERAGVFLQGWDSGARKAERRSTFKVEEREWNQKSGQAAGSAACGREEGQGPVSHPMVIAHAT